MTPESPIIAELQRLLDALCEESITPSQLQRLEELVLAHPEAEAHYVRFMGLYADLIGSVAGLVERTPTRDNRPRRPADGRDPTAHLERKASPKRAPRGQENPMSDTKRRLGVMGALFVVFVFLGIPAMTQYLGWKRQSAETAARKAALDASRAEAAKAQADQEAALQNARKDLDAATAAQEQLVKQYSAAIDGARKAIEEKDFVVRLTGPAAIQPGAPNKWQIETLRHGAVGRPHKMEVVVKDAKDVELFKQTHDKPVGVASLELTAAFWEKVKPGSDLFLEVCAFTDDNRKSVLAERIPLARPVYVTNLATDKPLYKPGETVRFRSLTLDRSTLQPPQNDLKLSFRLRDPSDSVTVLDEGNGRLVRDLEPVLGPDNKPLRGIGVGDYQLAADAPGGEYKLDLYDRDHTGREVLLETRKFLVNRYVPDTFEKKLEFDGKSYGAGEIVQARLEVSRTGGGPMKDARASVVASVDGREIHKQSGEKFEIIPDGNSTKAVLNVRFKLPADIFEKAPANTPPNAVLSVTVQDASDTENILRPIPLVTKNLTVEFFPEGGDMVVGVPGRVYFQVRNPQGKPADVKGTITDGTDTVAEAKTETDAENPGVNRGHGASTFTPKAGKKYFLKIATPTGITAPTADGFPLPAAKADGVALTALDAVTDKAGAIRVSVQVAQGPKTLHVGAYARGRLIAHQKLDVEAGKPVEVKLQGDEAAGGVTRVTVFEEPKAAAEGPGRTQLIPRAERLVYRKPGEQLMLNINPDKARYSPSDKVRLDLSAFNEKEKPTPAVLLVAVVNQSVITMADNKTDRLMPTHFLLSGDVKHPAELEHADFLLTDHPKAGLALDLLLGTQGWRRFAEQNGAPVNPADKAEVDRMLVAHGQRTAPPIGLFALEQQRINAEYRPKMEQAMLRRATAETGWNAFRGTQVAALRAKAAGAQAATVAAEQQYTQAAAELYRYETRENRLGSWALPLFLVGLYGLALGGIALAANHPESRRTYVVGATAAFGLGLLVLGAISLTKGTDATEVAYNRLNPERNATEVAAAAPDAEAPAAGRARRPMAPGEGIAVDLMARNEQFPAPNAEAAMPAPPRAMAPGGPGAMPPMAGGRPGMDPKAGPRDLGGRGRDALKVLEVEKADGRLADEQREKRQVEKALRDQVAGEAKGRRPGGGFGANRPMAPGPMGGMPARDMMRDEQFMPGDQGGGFAIPKEGDPIDMPQSYPFVVREYAHQRSPSLGDVRADFTETVYWHPVLVLPQSGKASVEFQLADNIGRYQVLVAGHTTDGRIGAVTKTIEARKPFSLDPKFPLEISHTDAVDVPIRVNNDSDNPRAVGFTVVTDGVKLAGNLSEAMNLGPNGKGRKLVRLTADKLQGDARVAVTGVSAGADNDTIVRGLTIVPDGFPAVGSFSDTIEGKTRGTVSIPKGMVPGTLKVRLEVYPTSMADLVKGLDGLLREPYGCFEQTSTSNYPNTLILDYMNQTNQANPAAAKRAKELLDRGYAKLVSFECPDTPQKVRQGFEWFGSPDMQHEALTAYGLLQFKDMARVHQVDAEMIKRTQAFLLSRRDGEGGFKRNARALDSFGGAPKHTTDAYIVWALVESDPDDKEKLDLAKEIAALKKQAMDEKSVGGKDAYFVALVANVLLQRDDRETAHKLLDRLQEKHTKSGAVTGAVTSITRSGGRDLEIETTAMALLGWLRANDPKYATTVKESTKWISQQRGGYGGFGSTQSTIMALKALTLHAKKSAHPAEAGEVSVFVDGKKIATRKFTEKDVEVIGLDVEKPETIFKAGEKTEVVIETSAKQAYPFALSYTYTTLTPVNADKCAVRVSTKLGKAEATEGESVPLAVTLENVQKQGQGMAVAIVGIPAGMRVPTDMKQLTDLREKGRISFFELRGRELVLYWRELAPEAKITLTVDLVCDVPGEYRGPASRGYLYYNADHKHWVEPVSVKIAPSAAVAKDEPAAP